MSTNGNGFPDLGLPPDLGGSSQPLGVQHRAKAQARQQRRQQRLQEQMGRVGSRGGYE